ncbi:MAG: hypothetical protein IPM89_00795 [Candidatus Competibacteraceae bacterium]|nr:MAG: hypothetical protein IPM89_00795 [Candidatus Competibacteraceae bacterium]
MQLMVIIDSDEKWLIACCPEIPGANARGYTKEKARANLIGAKMKGAF